VINNYSRQYDGLRIERENYFEVKNITKKYDKYGDWVCVNVKGMSYERALEVCKHEVGHEIFAESLEIMSDNEITKLIDYAKNVTQ